MDIEFEGKQLSFGQVLLYRRSFLSCFIRNRSPIEIFWYLDPVEPLDSQILITPIKGIIKAQNDQQIEFHYHANKVKNRTKFILIFITENVNVYISKLNNLNAKIIKSWTFGLDRNN